MDIDYIFDIKILQVKYLSITLCPCMYSYLTRYQVDDIEYMLAVWGSLAEGAQQGARAVVLLLSPPHLSLFLHAGGTLRRQGLLRQGDFVFLMNTSPVPYLQDP